MCSTGEYLRVSRQVTYTYTLNGARAMMTALGFDVVRLFKDHIFAYPRPSSDNAPNCRPAALPHAFAAPAASSPPHAQTPSCTHSPAARARRCPH
jgi:hypothetical protein